MLACSNQNAIDGSRIWFMDGDFAGESCFCKLASSKPVSIHNRTVIKFTYSISLLSCHKHLISSNANGIWTFAFNNLCNLPIRRAEFWTSKAEKERQHMPEWHKWHNPATCATHEINKFVHIKYFFPISHSNAHKKRRCCAFGLTPSPSGNRLRMLIKRSLHVIWMHLRSHGAKQQRTTTKLPHKDP